MNPPRVCSAAIGLAIALGATHALAGANSYQCVIAEQLVLKDDGALSRPPSPHLIGKRFSVDRNTGVITGPDGGLWSTFNSKFTVLARGNADNSFVVLATQAAPGNGVSATLLSVAEYKQGARKPFVVLAVGETVSGTCE